MLEQYEPNQTCPGAQAEKNQHAALPARATHLVQAAINGKSVNLTKIANSVSENEERTPTCPFPLLPQRPGARLLPLPLPSPRSSGGSEPPKGSFPSPPAPVALQEMAREQKKKSTAYIIEWIALKVAPSTQGPAFAFSQAQCWQIRILGEKGGDFKRARPRARGVALSPAQGLMEKQKQPLARRRSRTEMGRAPQRWASAWLRAGLKLYFGLSGEGLLHQKLVLANWGPTSQAAILKTIPQTVMRWLGKGLPQRKRFFGAIFSVQTIPKETCIYQQGLCGACHALTVPYYQIWGHCRLRLYADHRH